MSLAVQPNPAEDRADNAAAPFRRPEASLSDLAVGETGRVCGFAPNAPYEASLREMGFAEGDEVELVRRGPFGAVMTVRLERALIALRIGEAEAVRVRRAS